MGRGGANDKYVILILKMVYSRYMRSASRLRENWTKDNCLGVFITRHDSRSSVYFNIVHLNSNQHCLINCNSRQILATYHKLMIGKQYEYYFRATRDKKARKIVPQMFPTESNEEEGVFLLAMEYLEPSDMLVMDTLGSAPWTQETRLQVIYSPKHTCFTV